MRKYVCDLKKFWKKGLPSFDHNCQKRLYGFIQGAFFRMLDDEDFAPNFLVKRKIEVPQGEIDLIADIIVQFVPVWEIFRSSQDDFWAHWASSK